MKSGLEGRNNHGHPCRVVVGADVSMKSGLEGRNNPEVKTSLIQVAKRLNEVRPRRPEQSSAEKAILSHKGRSQ